MALQILNAGENGDAEKISDDLRGRIEAAIEGAEVSVTANGPGHFEIRVVSSSFEGLSRVKQQQRVYGAIAELMAGPNAPVHAIDKLECLLP
ncbi:MAG: BolA family protein [Myxococcota bacterium]|nr:BolA family protein [Myxococcota bacterium]